jgi:hypothetical protein
MEKREPFISRGGLIAVARGKWISEGKDIRTVSDKEALQNAGLWEKYKNCPDYSD